MLWSSLSSSTEADTGEPAGRTPNLLPNCSGSARHCQDRRTSIAPRAPPRRTRRPPGSGRRARAMKAGGVVLLGLVVGILLLRPATPAGVGVPAAAIPTATGAPAGPASAVTPGGMQASDSTVAPATTAQGTPIAGLTVVSGLDRNHTK